jgi:acetyl-CoA carboxylase biotin carboxylase subunit
MNRALEMFIVEGVQTSIPLHQRVLADPDFLAGNFNTNFLSRMSASGVKPSKAAG